MNRGIRQHSLERVQLWAKCKIRNFLLSSLWLVFIQPGTISGEGEDYKGSVPGKFFSKIKSNIDVEIRWMWTTTCVMEASTGTCASWTIHQRQTLFVIFCFLFWKLKSCLIYYIISKNPPYPSDSVQCC